MTKGQNDDNVIKMPLRSSPKSVEDFIVLAEQTDDDEEIMDLLEKALEAANQDLGQNWESKYQGRGWEAVETRPVMHAMAQLATELRWDDQLDEALSLCRRLLKLNPSDDQGIRYDLAGCLYEAGQDDELEKLFAQYPDEAAAAFKYTRALLYFRQDGASSRSAQALIEAFKSNIHVPVFLSDIVDLPQELPDPIGIGDDSEAVAYAMEYCYLWADTEGALEWMSDELASKLRKTIADPEIANDIINALKGIYED
ncbi:MAG: tetratricopeptide repeat protein [Candidatus Melainabacteria bacterium]|nr:MAG: tetratricopeptide repeat protein [Candidatus Melainabacteria bacterium]